MKKTRPTIEGPDELDILSAIWILACNDEHALITYEGIKYRLGLPGDYDVRELVQSRGELFRTKGAYHRLAKWKQEMLQGKRLPAWIRDTEDEQSRRAKIEALTTKDIFRSQFRAEESAPRSPIEIIDWGLQHIDRLRKARVEARDEKAKRWANMWIPLLSTIVALTAVLSSAYLQNKNSDTQIQLKRYEVSFRPKQEWYSIFMRSLVQAYDNAFRGDHDALVSALDRIEASYYSLEPFLDADKRTETYSQYQKFAAICYGFKNQSDDERNQFRDSFIELKNSFRTLLYPALFAQ